MHPLIRAAEQRRQPNGIVAFESRAYGGGVSMTVGRERIEAGAGDIIVVSPETPDGFRWIDPERLEITCIHASDRFIQEWVMDKAA